MCVEAVLPDGTLTGGEPAVDDEVGSGHPRRFVPDEERYPCGDVVRRAEISARETGRGNLL